MNNPTPQNQLAEIRSVLTFEPSQGDDNARLLVDGALRRAEFHLAAAHRELNVANRHGFDFTGHQRIYRLRSWTRFLRDGAKDGRHQLADIFKSGVVS